MSDANTFHCPHCGAGNPASDGVLTCHACAKQFEPARVETVPQPASQSSDAPIENNEAPGLARGADLGGYLIEAEIGRGGMGVVYLGVQKSLERKVAVKVLPKRLAADSKFRTRFEREALALATLNHHNIVQIIDRGISGDTFYLVMEYVEGVSLRRLQLDGKLKPEQALAIVPQICAALEYAHGKGLVHRDIKPENILLTTDGHVKITDFGLARMIHGEMSLPEQRLTHTHVLMGTPEYMAPEQRERAKSVDHRADIFSLGVIFYEMLTGELPIGRFQLPSKKVEVDVRLDEVILKSLEKEPDLRYQRARMLSKDVEGIASTYSSKHESRTAPVVAFPSKVSSESSPAAPSAAAPSPAPAPTPVPISEGRREHGSRLAACFQLKNGRRIEVGPQGVRVFEPAPEPALAQVAAPAVTWCDAKNAKGGYSPLAIAAFVLALPLALAPVGMGFAWLLMSPSAARVSTTTLSNGTLTITSTPGMNLHFYPITGIAVLAIVLILTARKIFRRST